MSRRQIVALGSVFPLLVAAWLVAVPLRAASPRAEETALALAQSAPQAFAGQEAQHVDLYSAPAKVLAQGNNRSPSGPLGLRTFQVEEINLPAPVSVDVDGVAVSAQTVFRLTITGGPFPVRALPPVISIDNVEIHEVQESPDLSALWAIVVDRSILKEGATITVAYGTAGDSLSTLPERLTIQSGAN
jgi:hypothetical protein